MTRYINKFFEGEIYHIFNKTIAGFKIFQNIPNGERFIKALNHYNKDSVTQSLSAYLNNPLLKESKMSNLLIPGKNPLIKFLSYCIMPDHYHLVIKVLADNVFSKYISDVENSFTRFFNIKFKRKGPMWQHSVKSVRVKSDSQLLHLTRYVNINSTTSGLVENPADWHLSSYRDIIDEDKNILKDYLPEISISSPKGYKQFAENHKDYQRKLKLIKKLILE